MNDKSQQRKIKSFLRGNHNIEVDAFCLYQWLERCHFQHWWGLGISLGSQIPPGALDQEYRKRLAFLLSECRRNYSEEEHTKTGQKKSIYPSYPYGTKLNVSPEEALNLLKHIHHDKFLKALDGIWQIDERGFVRAQSVLWLFCWAKTGNGSRQTAYEAQAAFNMIMPFSIETIDTKISHSWARNMRYFMGNIERDFENIIAE